MKTALFYGGKDIRVVDMPTPEPGPGEAVIRVRSSGVCGSDLHNYRGNRPSRFKVPWQQGHELAGEVVRVGAGVSGLKPGQRVAIEGEHLVGCGKCRHCRAGQNHLCPDAGLKGGEPHGSHGYSQFDVCIAANCHPIPDSVSFDAAALIDCYACAVHALNRTPLTPGDTIAVIGAGAIALTFGQVAKAYGAGRVIMVGTRQQPLDVARASGAADDTVVTSGQDPVKVVMDLTGGQGADMVAETVGGNAQVLDQCIQMARRGGSLVVLGVFTAPQTIDALLAMRRELTVRWSNSLSTWQGVSEYGAALKLLAAGKLNAGPIVTHHFPLDKITDAFAAADDKRGSGAIRVMVHP